jgi:hypothetical protein
MKIKDLAYALGISEAMVYRHMEKGMPTASIELAEKWRAKRLDPMRTKSGRSDGNTGKRAEGGAWPAAGDGGRVSAAEMERLAKDPFWNHLEKWQCRDLPEALCDPIMIAFLARQAGLHLDGRQALGLAQNLFVYYRTVLDPGGQDRHRFEVPAMLGFRPCDEGFDIVAGIIERAVEFCAEDACG